MSVVCHFHGPTGLRVCACMYLCVIGMVCVSSPVFRDH